MVFIKYDEKLLKVVRNTRFESIFCKDFEKNVNKVNLQDAKDNNPIFFDTKRGKFVVYPAIVSAGDIIECNFSLAQVIMQVDLNTDKELVLFPNPKKSEIIQSYSFQIDLNDYPDVDLDKGYRACYHLVKSFVKLVVECNS